MGNILWHALLWVGLTLFVAPNAASAQKPGGGATEGGQTAGKAAGGPRGAFQTEVPAHGADVVLGRPTATSVTLSVLSYAGAEAMVAYGWKKDELTERSEKVTLKKNEPKVITLKSLKGDTAYWYQVMDAASGEGLGGLGVGTFHTQRGAGSAFVFTVQADSHLDENTSTDLYRRTLANVAADRPDFHVDLGDTFMTGKHASRESAAGQYLAQRYYLGLVGPSVPVFLTMGNHDGEESRQLRGGADSLAVWSNRMRERYFPNPEPDAFYGGDAFSDPWAGALEDYYAWQWGDALFVVLNPYWYSAQRREDNWGFSLGTQQYEWLKQTLAGSKARYKFVFVHQLVGGLDAQGRGGVEAAPYYEWGGKNADGSAGFKEHRPGWEMPIHQLLVRHQVAIVFHGHDHLFVRQELDGVVYQEVPQPGFPGLGPPRSAAEYGYREGVIRGSSGHLRVSMNEKGVTVEYVKAYLPRDENAGRRNGEVGYAYGVPKLNWSSWYKRKMVV